MAIFIPKKTLIKPDNAVINLGHPSSKGLVVACLTDGPSTSVRNLVNNTRATPNGTQLFNRVGKYGRGMINADGGANYYDTTANLGADFTLISFQSCNTGIYQCILDDDPVSSNRAFQYRTTDTDCVEFIRFDNAGNPYLVTHDTPLTADERKGFHMAATSNGTDLAVWSNKRKFTGTLSGTPQTPNATIRALQIKGGSTYLDGLLYYWYAWNRVLSDGEIKEIMDDPFGLVTTPNRRIFVSAPAAGNVTGTLAATEANDSISASGWVEVTGTLAGTEANDSLSASGTHTIQGTLAATEANDSLDASGTVGDGVFGTLSVTDENDTAEMSGGITFTGTLSATEANDSLTASGWAQVTGTLEATEASDTISADGTVTNDVTGTLDVTDGNDTALISGIVGGEDTHDGADQTVRYVESKKKEADNLLEQLEQAFSPPVDQKEEIVSIETPKKEVKKLEVKVDTEDLIQQLQNIELTANQLQRLEKIQQRIEEEALILLLAA